MANSPNKETAPRGCLKLNDKIYPLFEGHNIIGRHPKAAVNIKHLNISKQHAIITIVDENLHYISDFESANGTTLNNTLLHPLQLYRLNNGASVKFADIFCTYKRLDEGEHVDLDQETQSFSETFYQTNTQAVEIPNSDEMILNEMATQIDVSHSGSINEMQTQKLNFDSLNDESSDESIDFATMQKACESQWVGEVAKSNGVEAVVEEIAAEEEKIAVEEEKIDEEDLLSQICPIRTSKKMVIESDSDTDCESTRNAIESQMASSKKAEEEALSSQICPVKIGQKLVIESDSETDCESPKPISKSRYILSDDSDTDIEKDTKNIKMQSTEDFNISGIDLLEKKPHEGSEMVQGDDSKQENHEGKELQENHEGKELQENHEGKELQENKIKESNSLDAAAANTSDQQQEVAFEGDVEVVGRESNLAEETDTESLDLLQQSKIKESNSLDADPSSASIRLEMEALDLYMQPTQKLSNDEGSECEDVSLPATQTLSLFNKSHLQDQDVDKSAASVEVVETQGELETKNEEIGVCVPPEAFSDTKTYNSINDPTVDEDMSKKDESSSKPVVPDLADIECLPPTQALELIHGDDKFDDSAQKIQDLSTSTNSESDFIAPTQALEKLLSESPRRKKKTQVPHVTADHDYSFELPPTQALEALHQDNSKFNQVEDQLYEIFATQNDSIMGTQQLVDVLQTSREDEVIDDSMIDDRRLSSSTRKSCRLFNFKKQPSSVEEVTRILDEEAASDEKKNTLEIVKKEEEIVAQKSNKSNSQDADGGSIIRRSTRQNSTKSKLTTSVYEECIEDSKITNRKTNSQQSEGEKEDSQRSNGTGNSNGSGRNRRNISVNDVLNLKDKEEKSADPKPRRSARKYESAKSLGKAVEDAINSEEKKVDSGEESNLADRTGSTNESEVKVETGRKKQNISIDQPEGDRVAANAKTIKTKRTKAEVEDNSQDLDSQPKEESQGKRTKESIDRPEIDRVAANEKTKNKRTKDEVEDNSQDLDCQPKQESQGKKTRRTNKTHVIENETKVNGETETNESGDNTKYSKRGKFSSLASSKDTELKTDTTRKSRRKQNIAQFRNEFSEIGIDTAKEETNTRARRTKDKVQSSMEAQQEPADTRRKGNEPQQLESTKIRSSGRGKTKESSQTDTETPESGQRSTRAANKRKKDEDQAVSDEEKKAKNTKKLLTDEQIINKAQNKSNSQNSESNDSTPVGRTRINRSRKRNLKVSNLDSDDDATPKVAKTEHLPKENLERDSKTPMPTLRQSARKKASTAASEHETTSLDSQSDTQGSSTDQPITSRTRRLSANSRHIKKQLEKTNMRILTRTMSSASNSPQILTPVRSRRPQKPKVVFTMLDDPELESLVRQLGGSVVDNVNVCSVLVTDTVKRTPKLLCAVAQGKPICSPQWLYACKTNWEFVDPWDFILTDKEAEKKWDFSLRESLKRGAAKKLLEDHTFQLMVNTAADVLKDAIEACGGKCVTRNLPKAESEHRIIVSSENNRTKYNKIAKQNSEIKVVEAEAIFDGTLRQEFRFSRHLLT